MAKFGWAYVDCLDALGPTGSVQFLHVGRAITGSHSLRFHTAAVGDLTRHTLVLSGNLVVTGTVSASVYNYQDISIIDATGSTFFGNTNDDIHSRTGSFWVGSTSNYVISASALSGRVHFRGVNGRYEKITATEATISSSAYIIGASASANQTLHLPTASAAGAGALLVIKDEYGTRASTSVTIKGNMSAGASTNLIDGQSSFILTGAMPAINLYSNGSNWQVF